EREHPAGQLLARAPRDGRPLRAVRDAGVSVRALIFDFDGLILETETPAYQAWVEVYRELGHELPKALWLDYIGREGGWFDAPGRSAGRNPHPTCTSRHAPAWVCARARRSRSRTRGTGCSPRRQPACDASSSRTSSPSPWTSTARTIGSSHLRRSRSGSYWA